MQSMGTLQAVQNATFDKALEFLDHLVSKSNSGHALSDVDIKSMQQLVQNAALINGSVLTAEKQNMESARQRAQQDNVLQQRMIQLQIASRQAEVDLNRKKEEARLKKEQHELTLELARRKLVLEEMRSLKSNEMK